MSSNVAKYLTDYLYRRNSVSVAGLGEFKTHYRAAQVDRTTKVVEPPRKVLVFDPSADTHAYDFVQFVAEQSGRDFSAAESELDEFARRVRREVEANGRCAVEGFGLFSTGLDGQLSFSPDRGLNFLKSTAGFGAVDLPRQMPNNPIAPTDHSEADDRHADPGDAPATVADVILGDFSAIKHLHKKAFGDQSEEREATESAESADPLPPTDSIDKPLPVAEKSAYDEIIERSRLRQAEEAAANTETETPPKRTIADVLAEKTGLDQTDEPSEVSKVSAKEHVAIGSGLDYLDANDGNAPASTLDESEERETNWPTWIGLGAIALLFFLFLGQLALSEKPLAELAPFSWFVGSSDETESDTATAAADNSEPAGNADELTETEALTDAEADASTDAENGEEVPEDSPTDQRADSNSDAPGQTAETAGYSFGEAPAGYHIVIGAFRERANAQSTVQRLEGDGYRAYAIRNDRDLWQCMIFAGSETKARQLLGRVQANVEPGAWIYRHS